MFSTEAAQLEQSFLFLAFHYSDIWFTQNIILWCHTNPYYLRLIDNKSKQNYAQLVRVTLKGHRCDAWLPQGSLRPKKKCRPVLLSPRSLEKRTEGTLACFHSMFHDKHSYQHCLKFDSLKNLLLGRMLGFIN